MAATRRRKNVPIPKLAAFGLLVIGTILVIGGVITSILGYETAEWLGKTIAIIVGALVALAGGSGFVTRE